MTRPLRYALSLAALVALSACADEPPQDTVVPETPVTVADVETGEVAVPVTATGVFGSRDEIPLAFKIGGVIAGIDVDEGQTVRRGQRLAALDLREIDATVARAGVALAKAERDEARARRLHDDSVVTRTQLQDATSALEAARADHAAARVNREYAVIVAPEDGIVLRRVATAGANVGAGMPVVLLGGMRRGRVLRVGLSDRDALRVQTGDRATVRFDAVPGQSYLGTVGQVGRAADPRTGTYAVEIALRNAESLPAGLVGQATIAVRGTGRSQLVPVDALVEADADSATVYTIRPGPVPTAAAHRVHIAALLGDRVAVSGLPDGQPVIARGAPYLADGTRVRVVRDAATPGAKADSPSVTKPGAMP